MRADNLENVGACKAQGRACASCKSSTALVECIVALHRKRGLRGV